MRFTLVQMHSPIVILFAILKQMANANEGNDLKSIQKNHNNVASAKALRNRITQLTDTVDKKIQKMENHLNHELEVHSNSIRKKMAKFEAEVARLEAQHK